MEVTKRFKFSASHVLPLHAGLCSNLHGHNWVLTVAVKGEVDMETGMVVDYGDIGKVVKPIIEELDHSHLGSWNTQKVDIFNAEPGPWRTKRVEWLKTDNPTSELLLIEIANELVRHGLVFSWLCLKETDDTSCTMTWEEFNGAPPSFVRYNRAS